MRACLDKRSLSTKGKFSTRESATLEQGSPKEKGPKLKSLSIRKDALESCLKHSTPYTCFDKRDIEIKHLREKVSLLDKRVMNLEQENWELQNYI